MKILSPFLVALAVTASSCASIPNASSPLDAVGVEKLVRDRLTGSQITSFQAEMKDLRWVNDTLGPTETTLPGTTSVWVVVARGTIKGGPRFTLEGDRTSTYTTANFVVAPESGAFFKEYLGGRQPVRLASAKIDGAAAIAAVREHTASSRIDDIQAELKTYQWTFDNLSDVQSFYTPDSPVWIVTATGALQEEFPHGEAPRTFKVGKFEVDAENGQLFGTSLYPEAFIPQAAQSPEPPSDGDFLASRPPSPHP